MRTVVSGVRSSWDTSDTNRCCICESVASLVICSCRLAAMWLNEAPRRATSSSPLTTMRSCSWPAASFSDTTAAWLTGLTTLRVTYQAIAPLMRSSAAGPEDVLDFVQGLLRGVEVVDQVELVDGAVEGHLVADSDARPVFGPHREFGGCPELFLAGILDGFPKVRGDD